MDILYICLILALFALSIGFVGLCSRLMSTGGKR